MFGALSLSPASVILLRIKPLKHLQRTCRPNLVPVLIAVTSMWDIGAQQATFDPQFRTMYG